MEAAKQYLDEQSFGPDSVVPPSAPAEIEGLDDLFDWASETISEGLDSRQRKSRERRLKRQVLNIIHRTSEQQAKAKYADELQYMQRRVIALLSLLNEKAEEISQLKALISEQFLSLQKVPELERQIEELSAAPSREVVNSERQGFLTALSKLKQERDYLEEVLLINENENCRLSKMLVDAKVELDYYRRRTWWQCIKDAWRAVHR